MRGLGITGMGALACLGLIGASMAESGCSASNSSRLTGSGGNGNGPSTGPSAGGEMGVGGFMASGGNDASGGAGGACVSVSEEAKPQYEPADIIFAVDTSGSMSDEIGFTQQHLNQFSTQIVQSGIDVRVVMLAEHPFCPLPNFCAPGVGLCIAPPLGSGTCPPDDNNPPTYIHPMGTEVGSTDALSVIVDTFPSYSTYLRPQAKKYVVIITDDNASAPNIDDAQTFINTFTALDPQLAGFTAHAIYCFSSGGDCVVKGQVYEDLVNLTGGIHGDLALQDFLPIFNDMATQVIINSGALPCEYGIPDPPMGETFDPNKVNVVFVDGQLQSHDIYKVPGAADCHPTNGGWYYDDATNPTKVILCPASCDIVSADEEGKIDIAFNCATKEAPPS